MDTFFAPSSPPHELQENNTTPYLRKTGQKVCSPGL